LSSAEFKLKQTGTDVAQLQAKVGEYERLLEDNRNQVHCMLLMTVILMVIASDVALTLGTGISRNGAVYLFVCSLPVGPPVQDQKSRMESRRNF